MRVPSFFRVRLSRAALAGVVLLLVAASGMQGAALRLASWDTVSVTERELRIPWRGGALRGRMYVPAARSGRTILLVPGVHAAGIDEPRLVGFAREIAGTG